MSGPIPPWPLRVSLADSCGTLNCLMDSWYDAIKAAGDLQHSIGFDSYMERRDWESARRSIERTYGRSSREHRISLDTLDAAIHFRTAFGCPPAHRRPLDALTAS